MRRKVVEKSASTSHHHFKNPEIKEEEGGDKGVRVFIEKGRGFGCIVGWRSMVKRRPREGKQLGKERVGEGGERERGQEIREWVNWPNQGNR